MKILSQIKKDYLKKGAKMTAVFLLPVILIQASLVFSVQAAGPRFNIFTPYVHTQTAGHDYYLLDVKNETKNTDWNFPVSADPGDVLVFYFYYHNGVESTTALNTTMRVSLPSGQSTQHTVTAYLWADNAENATPSSPMSQSVGVNLSSSQSLDYVAGSAKWYPDRADWRYDPSTPFPSGQSEQQLFGSGINVGSIIGCWEYSGAIVFKAKVGNLQPPSTYDLSISKTVRNITAGQSSYSESVNAVNNDRLSFQIQIQNTGNAVLNNVIVRDALPSYISYLSGTTKVDGVFAQDGIASSGINIGSINTSMAKIVTFEASVNTSGLSSSQTLTNYGYGRADQVAEKSDTATISLSIQPPSTYDLSISKTVRNITSGQSSFVESTNANNNDRLAFQIQIQNIGNATLGNVLARDVLPSYILYLSGTTKVDGVFALDGITSGGINIGSIAVGATKTVTFEVSINASGASSSQTLTNYGYARADQVAEKSDPATVYLNVQPPSTYDLSISKTVRNITAGQSSYSESVNAVNNDRLSFQIQIQNTGNAVLNNVIVRDALPSYISYLSGTTKVDGVFAQDGIASSGINIGSINTSMAKIVTFEASVNTSGLSSSQTLTNYGYGRADQVAEKSDTATVYVSQQQAGNLNIVKYVRNLTTNQASLVSSTNANAGDRVLFSIQISNYGSGQVNNVRVWDTLPSGLTYVSGSVQVDNVYSSDSLFSSGINLGTLVANQSKTINFEATVNSGISNQTLINYAYVVGDGVGQLSAYAQVVVGQVIVTPSGLVKKVANVTLPNGTETDNQASVGDVLNYTISYTNTSGPALYNVQIFDVLPSYTSFQSVENSGVYDSTKNQITWNIGTMSAGASVSVSYRVKVLTVPVSGTIITNTALFKAQAISDIISNETRTTVLLPGVKGVVTVVTGSSSLVQNLAYSLLISILFVAAVYLVLKHADYLRWLKLKLMILKIKIKES